MTPDFITGTIAKHLGEWIIPETKWRGGSWRVMAIYDVNVKFTTNGSGSHWRYYKFEDMESLQKIIDYVKKWDWQFTYAWETKGASPPFQAEFKRSPQARLQHTQEPQWDAHVYRIPDTR